jgi:hypothetical protein
MTLDDLSRPVRLMFESTLMYSDLMERNDGDASAAADEVRGAVTALAERVAELAGPFDAFDVLEQVRLTQLPFDVETYQETEHEGLAAVIELTAAVLATRGHRAPTKPASASSRPDPSGVIDEVVEACRGAVRIGSFLPVLNVGLDDTARHVRSAAVLREVGLRNMAYPHMASETLSELFDEPSITEACRRALGCSVADILAVTEFLSEQHSRAWSRRFDTMSALEHVTRAEHERFKSGPEDYEPDDATTAAVKALYSEAWELAGDASRVDSADISAAVGVDRTVVDRVIELLSLDMQEGDPGAAAVSFLEGHSPFRLSPILRDPHTQTATIVQHGLLLESIREAVERQLGGTPDWEAYNRHRAAYVERKALDLIATAFPGAVIHQGFKYFVPNPRQLRSEDAPSKYTKIVEADGLLLADDVALIVEAKAGSLRPQSRVGDHAKLISDLTKLLGEAAEQANRLRERITVDRGLRRRDGSWLDLSQVREIHSLVVTLEDLSGIATVTADLIDLGLLSTADPLPWTVSLHDLRVVSELVDLGAELLLYLRHRTSPVVTRWFRATDELDFFLEFLERGLYVEPDPLKVAAEMPELGRPPAEGLRAYRNQKRKILTSRTDQLDAWYFHQLGLRESEVPKPAFGGDPQLVALARRLQDQGDPGWLRTAAGLLDGSAEIQGKWGTFPTLVVNRTERDGNPHSLTALAGTSREDKSVFVWATPGRFETLETACLRLSTYLRARKHQDGIAVGAAFMFKDNPNNLVFTCYDNRVPGPDEDLDALATQLGLRSLRDRRSTAKTSGRYTPPKQYGVP